MVAAEGMGAMNIRRLPALAPKPEGGYRGLDHS